MERINDQTVDVFPKVIHEDWGLISYRQSWDRQTDIHLSMIELKKAHRDHPDKLKNLQVNHLVFCTHPHVYTLGKSGKADHLKLDDSGLEAADAEYFKINRGGDITYHGPGQIVGYFLFDLDCFRPDVHLFVRNIEEGIIRLLVDYGVQGIRIKEYTGVWVHKADGTMAKVCAIGVHLSRWVSMHGFAFNINPQLNYFKHIVACGIEDEDKSVTSLEEILGRTVDIEAVKIQLWDHFQAVFGYKVSEGT